MGKNRKLLDATRPRDCNGKTIYKSRKAAAGAAARSRKRTGDKNIKEYSCPEASHFHIGYDRPYEERKQRALANAGATALAEGSQGERVPRPISTRTTRAPRVVKLTGEIFATINKDEEGV